jgi:hypothetical protein
LYVAGGDAPETAYGLKDFLAGTGWGKCINERKPLPRIVRSGLSFPGNALQSNDQSTGINGLCKNSLQVYSWLRLRC